MQGNKQLELDLGLENKKATELQLDIEELSRMQKKFDDVVLDRFEHLKGQDNLLWKVNAMVVEMSECMQEWKGFKQWSKDKDKVDRDLLLEEYIDWLHFLLSVGLEVGFNFSNAEYEPEYYLDVYKKYQEDTGYSDEKILNILFIRWISSFFSGLDVVSGHTYTIKKGVYQKLMSVYIVIGYYLGFTWEDIYQEYKKKNQKNHIRQKENY